MNTYIDNFEKAYAECERNKTADETIVFAIGAGRILPKLGAVKRMQEAINYIKTLSGFIGIYSVDKWHTLLIFDSLNHAKQGKNKMKAKGIVLGNIMPLLIKKDQME